MRHLPQPGAWAQQVLRRLRGPRHVRAGGPGPRLRPQEGPPGGPATVARARNPLRYL